MSQRKPIRMLILAKFEPEGLDGALAGEARPYYDAYCRGGESYTVPGCASPLYVKDGVALIVTGMGKINAAITLTALLLDPRFDFSGAYFLSTGCAGSAAGSTVMGDVVLVTATADYDLGHHADCREMEDPERPTWFADNYSGDAVCCRLDPALTERVWALVKDFRPRTTERTRAAMRAAFGDAPWARREPQVLCGTAVTGDNYWKGRYGHRTAELIAKTYGCPDPYAVSEMEDHALARVLARFGLLAKLVVIRGSVNMDVFMGGLTPEALWAPEHSHSLTSAESAEAADLFPVAMQNIFEVGRVIVDAALSGLLT